jgi:nicotinate phosphoribosyltransferase
VVSAGDEDLSSERSLQLHHPHREGISRHLDGIREAEELVVPVFGEGERICPIPSLDEMRARRSLDLERLDPGVRRLVNPHVYHVSLTDRVKALQGEMIARERGTR